MIAYLVTFVAIIAFRSHQEPDISDEFELIEEPGLVNKTGERLPGFAKVQPLTRRKYHKCAAILGMSKAAVTFVSKPAGGATPTVAMTFSL